MAGEGDEGRGSKTTVVAVLAGVGVLVVAGLLLAAFQLGRVVERDDRDDAVPDIAYPLIVDQRFDPLDDLALDRRVSDILLDDVHRPVTDAGQRAADQFSVWIEPADGPEVQRIFQADGTVIELVGRLVDAGADDLRMLRLSSTQRDQITELVEGTGLRAEQTGVLEIFGGADTTLTISVSGHVRSVEVDVDALPEPVDVPADVARVVHSLFDLSFLDPTIETASEPWTPGAMTVWVDPTPSEPDTPTTPWPLDGAVLERTDGVERGPTGGDQPYRCLSAEQAASVFALLPGGTGRTMVVDDGGEPRSVALRFAFPFHVERQDLCS